MSDTIPAPGADKPADTPASEVKTPAAGKTELAPQADKPAGKDEQPVRAASRPARLRCP